MNAPKLEDIKLFLKNSLGQTEVSKNNKKLEDICTALEHNKPYPISINLNEMLGKGGFSYVFSSKSLSSKNEYAVKIIKPDQTKNLGPTELKDFKKKFYRECIIQEEYSKKHQSSIVRLFDYGEFDNTLFMIMERMSNITLRNVIRDQKTWSEKNKLEIAISLSKKLSRIHNDDLFHRDIKPENILLSKNSGIEMENVKNKTYKKLNTSSRLKYADFGLVKWVYSDSVDHYDGWIVGTPRYRSPEQIKNPHSVDHRTDIYSLGLVFCELLYGSLPGIDSTDHLTATEVISPETTKRIRPIVIEKNKTPYKEDFNEIIRKCLKIEPDERYSSIRETQKDLEKLKDYF